jgi:ArsR family transcriptional regulator, arsenate/arsenite/antimonite-responsive transcriptional repressor
MTRPRAEATACCPPVLESPLGDGEAAELAHVFTALSDPVRLRLLSLIAAAGEICACELLAPLGRSQPTVSHHTKILADAGLIAGEKRGRWVWWSVVPPRVAELRDALAPAEPVPA